MWRMCNNANHPARIEDATELLWKRCATFQHVLLQSHCLKIQVGVKAIARYTALVLVIIYAEHLRCYRMDLRRCAIFQRPLPQSHGQMTFKISVKFTFTIKVYFNKLQCEEHLNGVIMLKYNQQTYIRVWLFCVLFIVLFGLSHANWQNTIWWCRRQY